MKTKIAFFFLSVTAILTHAGSLLADSVNVTQTHTSSTKTTTYTILGMDQTTGIIVIAAVVIIVLLLIMFASRSSSKTETTIVK